MAPAFSCSTAPSSKLPLFSKKTIITRCTPLSKTTMLKQQQQQANWVSLTSEINTHILKSIPKSPPPSVTQPMHHLVSAAPPSVAPALCLAACELVGGQKDHAMNAACAIQLMHAAAHTHSQLLHLKHQDLRGGIQLMTGDGILPLGYEMAARADDCGDPERIVRVIVEMARAMGPQGMLEGQLMEVEGIGEEYWVRERKGGRLSACGAACGAIMGGGSERDVERMRRFGMYVGMLNNKNNGDDDDEAVAEVFRSLARLELRGFEEGKVDDVVGLFQLRAAAAAAAAGYNKKMMIKSGGNSLSTSVCTG